VAIIRDRRALRRGEAGRLENKTTPERGSHRSTLGRHVLPLHAVIQPLRRDIGAMQDVLVEVEQIRVQDRPHAPGELYIPHRQAALLCQDGQATEGIVAMSEKPGGVQWIEHVAERSGQDNAAVWSQHACEFRQKRDLTPHWYVLDNLCQDHNVE
jgi:hypothetical protein